MSIKGTIFDIKRFAIHDGPGIRTTIFFKGCPLKCWWCHNPEGMSSEQNLMFFDFKCIKCKTCVNVCPLNAITFENNIHNINRKICDVCGDCAKYCPTEALKIIGQEITTEELIKEIEKDILYFDNSNGGVTFSGGEPFLQHEFLKATLKECKKRDIHTAVDTSGYVKEEIFNSTIEYIDLFLYDIKLADDKEHVKYTGVPNNLIKKNLQTLVEMGRSEDVLLRFPIIPGITDTQENVDKLVEFVSTLKGINEITLLPFHDVSEKFKRLDIEYKMPTKKAPAKENLKIIKEKFESIGLSVKI